MRNVSKLVGLTVLLTSAVGTCNVWAAAPGGGAVFQRTENTQSIELSNIEDEGAARVPVVVESSAPVTGVRAAAQNPRPEQMPAQPAPTRVVKKKLAADGTEETDVAEGEEAKATERQADAGRATGRERNDEMPVSSMPTPVDGSNDAGAGASAGAGALPSFTNGTSAGSGSTAQSGTGTGTGTGSTGAGTGTNTAGTGTSGSGTSGTGSVPSIPSAPTATTALEAKLETYRNQMLQEVVNAQVTNPALTRRYQMVDKATYQSRAGL